MSFSNPLHPATEVSGFSITHADGSTPDGRWILDGDTAVFTPALFEPNATYVIAIDGSVGDGRDALGPPYSSDFDTQETTQAGLFAPTAEDSPLGLGPQTIGRRPEYVITWTTGHKTDVANQPLPPGQRIVVHDPQEDLVDGTASSVFEDSSILQPGAERVSVVGQFDEDGWDEFFVAELLDGRVTLSLFDTTTATVVAGERLPVTVSPEAPTTIAAFAAAAEDFDGDGQDELILFLAEHPDRVHYRVVNAIDGEFGVSVKGTERTRSLGSIVDLHASAGDVNADGRPEALLLRHGVNTDGGNSAVLAIFDDATGHFARVYHDTDTVPGLARSGGCPASATSLTTGDVDGDGVDEIFIGSTSYTEIGRVIGFHRCQSYDRLYYLDNFTPQDFTSRAPQGGTSKETHTGDNWWWHNWTGYDSGHRRIINLLAAGYFSR